MANENGAPGIGDNSAADIDWAARETERLTESYTEFNRNVTELLDAARVLPTVIENDEQKTDVVNLIPKLRDASKRASGFHETEKAPHFRRGQAVDNFFFGLIDKLARRDKKNRPGAVDILLGRVTDYDNRVLAAENERRRLAAEAAARESARLEAIRVEAERKAREAREAEERARKPETQAAKGEVAKEAEQTASAAVVEHVVAADRAEAAQIETYAKPADIMRTRTSEGTLSTMKREAYAEIEDVSKLDPAVLWNYISFAEKEKALRAYAKATGHTQQTPGARIGFRNKSDVR